MEGWFLLHASICRAFFFVFHWNGDMTSSSLTGYFLPGFWILRRRNCWINFFMMATMKKLPYGFCHEIIMFPVSHPLTLPYNLVILPHVVITLFVPYYHLSSSLASEFLDDRNSISVLFTTVSWHLWIFNKDLLLLVGQLKPTSKLKLIQEAT